MKIACVIGTRPEAIKMAPIIFALRETGWAKVQIISTGQHQKLLEETLSVFDINPDFKLSLMEPNQTLASLTVRLINSMSPLLTKENFDLVLAQGDTSTVMVSALVCFYNSVAFGHVEAGLRTGDLQSPFPEEFNRVVAGRVAALHFAPTERARENLLREGVSDSSVFLTGNTVIDALQWTASRVPSTAVGAGRSILVTIHRRENFGHPLSRICMAIKEIHRHVPDVNFVMPVHPNPNVRKVVEVEFAGLPWIELVDTLNYRELVATLKRCTLVLTDSGGLQEEAPALSKPVLVLRETTERPEAIECGVAKLVGSKVETIVSEAVKLLSDNEEYSRMARGASPYGDGKSSGRIVAAIYNTLSQSQS